MRFKKIIKLFEEGNVSVCGLRGRGKDLLMSNVVARRKLPYICNIDYGGEFYPFEYDKLDCGKNTYDNFLTGNVKYYKFDYPDGTDVYISDAGIYFPSQYCNELNKKYPYLAVYQAICRHTSNANFHTNSQSLARVYDKIREQSDIYILCRRCFYFHGFVLQWVTIYDRYDSAVQKMKPFQISLPLFANREMKLRSRLDLANFEASHGEIKNGFLIYRNRSNYDTRQFRSTLERGVKLEST